MRAYSTKCRQEFCLGDGTVEKVVSISVEVAPEMPAFPFVYGALPAF
jgi:hypothetical protein